MWVVGSILSVFLLSSVVGGAADFEKQGRIDGRMRGHSNAPLTLIEFADFTCPYCRKFFQETWPLLRLKYVEPGKLRFLYLDFPRAFEGLGLDAAEAARCAGDQNQYWQMHDRLFGSGQSLQGSDFQRHAQVIGLNLAAFSRCLDEKRHQAAIFRDRALGTRLGFHGTPSFIFLRSRDLKGESKPGPIIRIPGSVPFAVFEEQIDRLLGEPVPKGKD